MQNNDAFKLLYNNLWVTRADLPEYLRVSPVASEVNVAAENVNINSVIPENSSINAELAAVAELKSAMLNDIPLIETPTSRPREIDQTTTTTRELITSWDKLTDLMNNCTDCRLCNTRKTVVIERGNRNGPWMFIGEAPGENEDNQGIPFVGSAGQLLDKMLLAMKLDRKQNVYICNAVKCRPPKNRNPEPDEISLCNNYLLSQINLVKPKLIVALGRIAAHTLLKTSQATSKLRGKVHYIEGGIPLIVTYHPAYLLRNPNAKKDTWEDLQLAMETFATLL